MSVAPPQGPLQPGDDYDEWLLAGLLIQAENRREALQDARWRQLQDRAAEASPDLAASVIAWCRIRSEMNDRALRVVCGVHSLAWASCVVCHECPEFFEELLDDLRHQVVQLRVAVERQTDRIRWAIKPLIADRAPGDRIVAAAENVGGPLPRKRILEVCRHAAAASQHKRRMAYA